MLLVGILWAILWVTYTLHVPDEWIPSNNFMDLPVNIIMLSRFNPINILMHSGIKVKLPLLSYEIPIFPQFAPNTCAAAAKVEGGDGSVWPCQRDAIFGWYDRLRVGDESLRELFLDDRFSVVSGLIFEVAFYVVLVVWGPRIQAALLKRLKQRKQDGEKGIVLDAAASADLEGGSQDVKEALDLISVEATMA